jgi:hypothetical protein
MQVATALIVLALVTLGQAKEQKTVSELNGLCKNQRDVVLRTVTELKQFSEVLNTSGEQIDCSSTTKGALNMLVKIAGDPKPCTQVKADQIVKFTNDYLKKSAEELPKALYEFAVAYGMQVSRVCKQLMYDAQFVYMENKLMVEKCDIMNHLQPLADRRTNISRILEPILKTGEFILPSDLFEVLPELKTLKLPEDHRTKALCNDYLRPAYKEPLMPIVTLDRAGYSFKGIQFKIDSFLSMSPPHKFYLWAKMVFMCEAIAGADNPIDQIEPLKVGDERKDYLRRLSWDDQRLVEKAKIGDTILSKYDFRLKRAVKSFNPNLTLKERLQERVLANSYKILRTKFSHDSKFREFVTGLMKEVACSRGKCRSSEDIEKVNDDVIKAVTSNNHSLIPVIGHLIKIVPLSLTFAVLLFTTVVPATVLNAAGVAAARPFITKLFA